MDNRIKSLCKRARKADKDAACELLRIHYTDVYSYLRCLCASQPDAEDLTQQTFLKVWSSLDGFAGRSKFSTWLYRQTLPTANWPGSCMKLCTSLKMTKDMSYTCTTTRG